MSVSVESDNPIPPALEEYLEKAPPEIRTMMLSMSTSRQYYRGPLPPPDFIEGYNRSIPNGGDRLMKMAEKQQDHRIDIESKVIESDVKRANLGLIIGSIITFAALSGAFFLISIGKSIEGGLFGGTPLITLVALFVRESNSRRQERQGKAANVPKDPGKSVPESSEVKKRELKASE